MTTAANPLVVACLQSEGVPGDVDANISALDDHATQASTSGAHLLITDEMFVSGYDCGAIEHVVDDPAVTERLREIARRHRIALLVGMPERLPSGGIGNCAVFLGDDGERLACHTKSHLYGSIDKDRFEAGDRPFTLVDYRGVRVAIMICFDVEFPENPRAAALAGADLIAVPTANMKPYDGINEHLLWTRAWENQTHVAYVNHCGTEGSTHYVGRSIVVAPDGEVLATAGAVEALLITTIDPSRVAAARRGFSYLAERRPALYTDLHDHTQR